MLRKGVKRVYTAMVKDPFRKWDRVDTVCALLVDLGVQPRWSFVIERFYSRCLRQIMYPSQGENL